MRKIQSVFVIAMSCLMSCKFIPADRGDEHIAVALNVALPDSTFANCKMFKQLDLSIISNTGVPLANANFVQLDLPETLLKSGRCFAIWRGQSILLDSTSVENGTYFQLKDFNFQLPDTILSVGAGRSNSILFVAVCTSIDDFVFVNLFFDKGKLRARCLLSTHFENRDLVRESDTLTTVTVYSDRDEERQEDTTRFRLFNGWVKVTK